MLAVLRGSTIAQERGKDVESHFWETYKNVSNEHDNDLLERANDDMGIILTFVCLFMSVIATLKSNKRIGWFILSCELYLHRQNAAQPRRHYECPDATADQGHR
jgi:hypothetical protein